MLVGGGGCSFRASPTGQGPDDAGTDSSADAALVDVAPGTVCYGPPGAWQVCLAAAPTEPVGLPPTLDTDSSKLCLQAQPARWTLAQPGACFIVGDTVTVGATSVTGARPLVLLAQTRIQVDILLDVASHHNQPGPAAPSSACMGFGQNPSGSGGGGGAGGSFMTRGGNGGRGDGGQSQNGQSSDADGAAPTQLRGGCAGQVGSGSGLSKAGAGGGAVYLVSGDQIVITGRINASGGGGAGDNHRNGGSGGGTGGVIVLHGTTIATLATTVVVANGGGGAGGGSQMLDGVDGGDPGTTLPLLAAAGGSNGVAGAGGAGFPETGNALDGTGGPSNDGGGGGGGGAGYIRANHDLAPATVSPLADIVIPL
jgi:hypothetical protein